MKRVNVFYRNYDLPWTAGAEEHARLMRILKHVGGVLAVLAILIPFLPVKKIDHHVAHEVPPRFARLVAERKVPPPVVVQPPPKPVESVQPRPEAKATVEPAPAPVKQAPAARVVPTEKPAETAPAGQPGGIEAARARASQSGVVAFAAQLAELRDSKIVAGATESKPLSDAVGPGPRAERSLVTSAAGMSSGGINTASLSRNTGGGGGGDGSAGLAGRAVTQVTGPAGLANAAAAACAAHAAAAEGRKLQRSREEIELVFDRNKSAIYALYHRALREDPTLQGKVVLKLTIAPSGQVTGCEVVSSELESPDLEHKLVQRVLMFDFGAKDVEEITTTKPIDFFPA
jgi:TonB family protein